MSTEKKHTPTPWVVYEGLNFVRIGAKDYAEYINAESYLGGPMHVATMNHNQSEDHNPTHDLAMANGELIVRAVNAHEQVLEALEDCDKAMTSLTDRQLIDNPAIMQAIVDVRAAIRAAKGGAE